LVEVGGKRKKCSGRGRRAGEEKEVRDTGRVFGFGGRVETVV